MGSRLARPLLLFGAVQAALILLCFGVEAFCRFVLDLHAPYTYALRTRWQNYLDFSQFKTQFFHFGKPDFFLINPTVPFTYPAPLAVAYQVFFAFRPHPLPLFLAFILTSFLASALLLGRALRKRGVAAMPAYLFCLAAIPMGYPIWFEVKQANIEICVWVFVSLGILAFCKGRGYSAAACFGIAGSMKIFPFVYLGLLLSARKYREMVYAVFVAAVTTVASLWLVGPGIVNTWRGVQAGIAAFQSIYLVHLRPEEIGFDHSLFAIYKRFRHPLPGPEQMQHNVTIYLATAALVGITLYFLRIRRLPLTNQVLCLVVASILLPPLSFDYTLIYIYIPWAMMVLLVQVNFQAGAGLPGATAALVCMAILCSPESEFILHGMHAGGQIKAVVLAVLMGIGLRFPFPSLPESIGGEELSASPGMAAFGML